MNSPRWQVSEPGKLSSWRAHAKRAIKEWLDNETYQAEIMRTVMKNEAMGPFTKFLYAFAFKCECGWGVMIDFNERTQRVFLTDRYYQWMHKIRDEIVES